MNSFLPYGKQSLTDEDKEAVLSVLNSEYLTQGPKVKEFEQAVSNYCNVEYATAANSATSALHIACTALNLKKNDIVWTTPISFVATANCALYCGARVEFVDIDPDTLNISTLALAKKLEIAKKENVLPKLIIVVHFAGLSCDMQALSILAKNYGFKIIEDASHAIGGKYQGEQIGNCHYSDITVFSFHPVKIITSAEGGVATTNNKELKFKMDLYRSHGIVKAQDNLINEPHGEWYYEQQELGFNYRMSDLHAALGLSQLSRLDEFVSARNKMASKYREELDALPLSFQEIYKEAYSAYHLFVIKINHKLSNISRNELFKYFKSHSVGVQIHYIPIYRQPYYQKFEFDPLHFPNAEEYYSCALTIPLYPGMTHEQFMRVCNLLQALKK